jgi:DNA/RNA-binding domain of Phe-tRNA-synthetase-like protein
MENTKDQMIAIDEAYTEKLPAFKLGIIKANVTCMPSSENLITHMNQLFEKVSKTAKVEDISKYPEIVAGRAAYRAFGKDPTKYRLSAEKLLRRIIKGEGLDTINNIVDLSNILSLSYKCPVGTFDYSKIDGDVILRAGMTGESYLSLGNQELNIEGLPIFADNEGPFGSTTSDSARTSVDPNTKTILLTVFGFEDGFDFTGAMQLANQLIIDYADGEILISEMLMPKNKLQLR